MQKEQGLHEMAAIKIPTDGGRGREVAFPSWSETKNRRADSEQVLQSSGCSLFTSKYFKISLRPSGQLFCDMGCLFKGTMALLQSARFVAVGPAALERFGWRRSHRLTVQNYFFFFHFKSAPEHVLQEIFITFLFKLPQQYVTIEC